MKRRKKPHLTPFQATAGTIPRPTCCAPCQQLYDAVHTSCTKAAALGVALDADKLYLALREPRECLLCGRAEVTMARMYVPREGLRRGKGAGVLYWLCQRCDRLPEATRGLRVEAMVMAALVGRRN